MGGPGTLRDLSSFPTSFLRRRWASAGPKRSGPGSHGGWTSGRGVSMRVWWGKPRLKGPPGRAGPPQAKKSSMRWYPGVIITQCCLVSSFKTFTRQPTGRGEGVSSRITNARKPGDRLQRSSGKITRTCVSPLFKTPHAQPSRSMRRFRKQYPSTSWNMT